MGPLLDLGRRDCFHKVGGCSGHILAYCLHDQAGIPGGVKVASAFAIQSNVVAAFVIFEGDVKRLMDIAHPMSEEPQRH